MKTYTAAQLDDLGYSFAEFDVVRFHDTNTDRRWFNRDFDVIGRIRTAVDGCVPLDSKELLAFVHAHYGSDACVIY